MSETLVVGIVADTSNPGAAARLLRDLGQLVAADGGFSRVEVVVLENPSSQPDPGAARELSVADLDIVHVGRASQERDAARGWFGRVEMLPGRLPIATARTIVQRHAFERAAGERASVWILDEDLRLLPLLEAMARGEPPLSERLRCLRKERVDVAIGPVLGAPPLPARSTARVNLEDVRRHLDMLAALDPHAPWPDRAAENARVRRAFPEYYYDLSRAHVDAGAHPMWLEPASAGETVRSAFARLAAGVSGLLDGTPITRAIPESPALAAGSSLLVRGGNTLILRPSLLAEIPNLALRLGGRTSRRSDMLWARLAKTLQGARFARASITALQDRSGPGRSSFDPEKLLDDVRGSALVAALDTLIEQGALARGRSIPRELVERASTIYVARVGERLEAVHRSEARARSLLQQMESTAAARDGRSGFLRHPAHAEAVEQLIENARRLLAAYEGSIEPCDPSAEQLDVERFFLGLADEIDAYRKASIPSFQPARSG
ncbi:hypothetical protein [Polyangium aurulentum]|uniref:hypothetical protein n=1 Tax=Polyangium aurulentum TaxID=2567896 RepID=UPI0010ADFEF8|nr:hypothetical protein [Polyangium aurulentum]UQA58617.1 hypothetical protein E8A73_046515 [Polyangium aurulentum]